MQMQLVQKNERSEGATIERSWMWDVWPKFEEHCVEIHHWKVLYIMVSFCFASLWRQSLWLYYVKRTESCQANHVLFSINFLLRDCLVSCNKSRWSDSYTTEFKGKKFFVFDIVNVFRVNEFTEICIGCYLSSTRLRRCGVRCVQAHNAAPNSWRSHCLK